MSNRLIKYKVLYFLFEEQTWGPAEILITLKKSKPPPSRSPHIVTCTPSIEYIGSSNKRVHRTDLIIKAPWLFGGAKVRLPLESEIFPKF